MAEPDDTAARLARIEAALAEIAKGQRDLALELATVTMAIQALFRDAQIVDDHEPVDLDADPALAALLGLAKREPPGG